MKYMLLVYLDEQALSDSEREHCYVESAQLTQDLNRSGHYLHASPLHPVAAATSVRMREGKRLVTDGPFAESKEIIGGFFIIKAASIEEAAEIAKGSPDLPLDGAVEVREVLKM